MQASRRIFLSGLGLMGLSACVGGGGGAFTPGPSPAEAGMSPVPDAGFDTWVANFRTRAAGGASLRAPSTQPFAAQAFFPA